MTEEKKDDLNKQQTFLNDGEEVPEAETLAPTGKQKTSAPQHSPQHEELLKRQALEQSEVKEVLAFFRKYAKPAGIAVIVICAYVLVNRFFISQRIKKEARADAALMQAIDMTGLQDVVDNYGSTPSGPLALMALAKEHFNAGQLDQAEALYTSFISEYGSHELTAQAEINLVTCKEAKGQLAEALEDYGEFIQSHEGSYLVPAARTGQARCLEALGKFDQAQIVYEDIIVSFPGTTWSQSAEFSLKAVLAKKQ